MNHRIRFAVVVAVWMSLGISAAATPPSLEKDYAVARKHMVEREIVAAGIRNPRVIEAMRNTPRHEFVAPEQRLHAYLDMAMPIGHGQTISPPFIVAYMTEQLDPQPTDKVLEIGTGSGYQAAVLSPLAKEVYSIEIVEPLGRHAAKDLKRLKYTNVFTKVGDGYQGWAEHAPFDKIIVTCSPESVPSALVEQLREGGRMVVPVGERYQQVLYLFKKVDGKLEKETLRPTLFVPMTGEAERRRSVHADPAKPTLVNGDFETTEGDPETPLGWHYQRRLQVLSDEPGAVGRKCALFSNTKPGQHAQALQGMAADARFVQELSVSLRVRGESIHAGQDARQLPALIITFFDENRAVVGESRLGPWKDSFAWRTVKKRIAVPKNAREAIVAVGLFGATGKLTVDEVRIEAANAKH